MENRFVTGETCRRLGCSECCLETEMPLTGSDAARISRVTGLATEDFTVEKEGMTVLRNTRINGSDRCFFLDANGLCSVYRVRPLGCRYYPVIWDLDDQRAIIHDYCPHGKEFRSTIPKIEKKVEKLVHRLLKMAK